MSVRIVIDPGCGCEYPVWLLGDQHAYVLSSQRESQWDDCSWLAGYKVMIALC